jgi:excisionase family DNA binding protein
MNEITVVTPWLNVEGAATYLATTEDAIRALVKRRRLPVHRTETGRLLFRPEELDAWILDGSRR